MTVPQRKILIVDDEEDLALILRMTFERAGYRVSTANSGRAALKIVAESFFDAVVTDIRMPDGDGVEFLENVRSLNRDKPVIVMVTGFSDLTETDAYDKGAQAIFTKPIDRKQIVSKVDQLLDASRYKPKELQARHDVDMVISLGLETGDNAVLARIINIGRGGFFVALQDAPLPKVGSRIGFDIKAGDSSSDHISGIGLCKWAREQPTEGCLRGIGVEFSEMDLKSEKVLTDLIQRVDPLAHIPRS